MRTPAFLPPFLATSVVLTLVVGACSGTNATTGGTGGTGMTSTAGTTSAAGTTATAGTTGAAGTTATAGTTGTGGTTGTAGSAAVAGSTGVSGGGSAAGGTGTAGTGGGSAKTAGCGMNPPDTDSSTKWIKHDIEVTGVDPAFVTMNPPDAGTTYNWTHRNYYMRLPTNYDSGKAYPITIGGSGCSGPETVGAEGGYAPLGVGPGETEAIQVALSYVISHAANPTCAPAFADKFPNTPEVPYLAAVVKDVQAKFCSDSKKVFLSGYSSGAFEAVSGGCANSDILRGYGVQIGGGLRTNGPMPCKGPIAAMFVVGLIDNENPIGPLDPPKNDSTGTAPARDELLKRNGCTDNTTAPWDPTYPACVKYTSCPAQYPVVWCPIPDAGHDAPNQSSAAPYVSAGLWKFWSTLP